MSNTRKRVAMPHNIAIDSCQSDGFMTPFPGANGHGLIDIGDENLPIAGVAGAGGGSGERA